MSIAQDTQTLRQYFVDNFRDDLPIVYDNQPAQAMDERKPWLRFSVVMGAQFHSGGDATTGLMVQQGRVWLQIFTPDGLGDSLSLEVMDDFATLFRNKRIANIRCTMPEANSSAIDTDNFKMTTINVPFEATTRYSG